MANWIVYVCEWKKKENTVKVSTYPQPYEYQTKCYKCLFYWDLFVNKTIHITSSDSTEPKATIPSFGPIEGQKWFDQISGQWESQKNRFALTYFGKIQFLPPCIWNLPFMSTASGVK